MKLPAFLYTLFLLLVTFLAGYVSMLDDQAGVPALAALGPVFSELSRVGDAFVPRATETIPQLIPPICLVLALLGIRRRPLDNNLFFLALIAGVIAEYFLIIAKTPGIGVVGYSVAFLSVYLAVHRSNPTDGILDEVQKKGRFSGLDALLLGAVSVVALVYRMYALNHNLDYFEGELSSYSAGATHLTGMFVANRGFGAWAPLGLLYYIPIYITTELYGITLLALRLSSAVVGIFTIPALYFFGKRVAGKEAGLLAAFLLALNTQHVGWGRTDIHPHGVTTWPALLVGITFLRAVETKRVVDYILLVLAMALTWHQYPSGQSAVAIPIFATGIYWLLNRGKLPFRWYNSIWIMLGAALWFIGLPLSYYYPEGRWLTGNPFNLTGPRALWGGLDEHTGTLERTLVIAETAILHLWNVIEAIFFKARHIFHQDFLAEVHAMEPRTYPWLLTPFMVVALIMLVRTAYRLEVAVLLSWIVVAILPGILSEQAYPKRLSTLFPALDLVGAIGIIFALTYIRRANLAWRKLLAGASLSVGLFAYSAFEARVWFSGIKPRFGEPPEIAATKEVAKHITPGTLVITELSMGYYTGKITYLLLGHLTDPANRPNLWLISPRLEIQSYIQDPMKALQFEETWAYRCTKLRDQIEETKATPAWKKLVFVLQNKPEKEDPNQVDIQAAMQRCNNPIREDIPGRHSFWVPLVVISCQMSDLK